MSDWIPSLGQKRGPIYLSIAKKLEADIASGIVTPGTRLLPLREMADRLNVSVGTISKAYTRAESNGLISVEVGRGTFVNERNQTISNLRQTSPISKNLALNVPPATGEKKLISETLKAIADDQSMGDLLSYLPHQGSRKHRDLPSRPIACGSSRPLQALAAGLRRSTALLRHGSAELPECRGRNYWPKRGNW